MQATPLAEAGGREGVMKGGRAREGREADKGRKGHEKVMGGGPGG